MKKELNIISMEGEVLLKENLVRSSILPHTVSELERNVFMRMEKNPFMRILPLGLKLWGMQIGAALSTSADTAIFSNIGRISMPEECKAYIDWFDFYTTTPKIEICMCSWQDKLTVNITSAYANTKIERNFFRILTEKGIHVEIIARGIEGGEKNAEM